jgi:molybdopterin synthase sulfur carrier subunit
MLYSGRWYGLSGATECRRYRGVSVAAVATLIYAHRRIRDVNWKLFADLAEAAGTEEPSVETDAETVGEALDALLESYPSLEDRVRTDDGALKDHINLLRNGEAVSEGLATPLDPDDELALFPPVSGGSGA